MNIHDECICVCVVICHDLYAKLICIYRLLQQVVTENLVNEMYSTLSSSGSGRISHLISCKIWFWPDSKNCIRYFLGLGVEARVWIRIRIRLELTLTFNSRRAMVMFHAHAKGQGQRSVGSKDKVATDRRTEANIYFLYYCFW